MKGVLAALWLGLARAGNILEELEAAGAVLVLGHRILCHNLVVHSVAVILCHVGPGSLHVTPHSAITCRPELGSLNEPP